MTLQLAGKLVEALGVILLVYNALYCVMYPD